MYEDTNSKWILEIQSRESRSIQCHLKYVHGTQTSVMI